MIIEAIADVPMVRTTNKFVDEGGENRNRSNRFIRRSC